MTETNVTPSEAPAVAPEATTETTAPAENTAPVETQGEMDFIGKEQEAKEEVAPVEEPKEETKEPEKEAEPEEESKEESPTEPEAPNMEELGYVDVAEEHKYIAEIAAENGITRDTLMGALKDGVLDVNALGDIPARDKMMLKSVVEAEYVKSAARVQENLKQIHAHAGGEEAYNAATKWVNEQMKTNPELANEMAEVRGMIKSGGVASKLGVQYLMDKFKGDENTSLPLSDKEVSHTSSNAMPTPPQGKASKFAHLDDNFKRLQEKYNK